METEWFWSHFKVKKLHIVALKKHVLGRYKHDWSRLCVHTYKRLTVLNSGHWLGSLLACNSVTITWYESQCGTSAYDTYKCELICGWAVSETVKHKWNCVGGVWSALIQITLTFHVNNLIFKTLRHFKNKPSLYKSHIFMHVFMFQVRPDHGRCGNVQIPQRTCGGTARSGPLHDGGTVCFLTRIKTV